jgi:Homeodomain-like domain
METERITLSQRERDRLKVLHEVRQRHLTQVEAAARLKVTDRQVRRMLLWFTDYEAGHRIASWQPASTHAAARRQARSQVQHHRAGEPR